MSIAAGLISMGGYLPAKEVPKKVRKQLVEFLRKETPLHPEYINEIETQGCLPGRIETNEEGWINQPWYEGWLENLPPKKRDDPFKGTIERRRVSLDPVSLKKSIHPHPMLSSDAETLAGALAIFYAGIDKNEIDLVLCFSLAPDLNDPPDAPLVQDKLGLKDTGAYSINTCCSSFITMLEIAMTYVRSGIKKKVLIIASALHSIVMDKSDYYSVYTGDGTIAGIVGEVDKEYDYISSFSTSHGNRHKAIIYQQREPSLLVKTTQSPTYAQEFCTFLDQKLCKEMAENASKDMADTVKKTLKRVGQSAADIDFFVTHQPVPWAAHAWREAIGIPPAKFYESYEKYGNLAAVSVPTNLLEAVEQGLIKAGDKVMLGSSGAGESYIALFQRIAPELIKSNKL